MRLIPTSASASGTAALTGMCIDAWQRCTPYGRLTLPSVEHYLALADADGVSVSWSIRRVSTAGAP
jgi:hypothetical protein